jgi:hypothetical protein
MGGLKKLIGGYMLIAGIVGLLTVGLSLNSVLAVVFFPVALLNTFVGGLGLKSVPLLGGLMVSYVGSVIAILLGLFLL